MCDTVVFRINFMAEENLMLEPRKIIIAIRSLEQGKQP